MSDWQGRAIRDGSRGATALHCKMQALWFLWRLPVSLTFVGACQMYWQNIELIQTGTASGSFPAPLACYSLHSGSEPTAA